MHILTIRTDKPEAELGLYLNGRQIAYVQWQAHRALAETIHIKIKELLDSEGKNLHQIEGLVVFKGPGSFTGLRIGISVANALAASLNIPIVATNGNNWTAEGLNRLKNSENEHITLPEYGSPPHITKPRK
jgi:tRNA threonylcarbamoyladenosine biosynthesis protein TsaB